MRYDAFISYSHAADGGLAPALQRGLQRLARPWHRRRALEVFRDQTGLSVSPALWSSIKSALDRSEYFLLLASPDAAASQWVNQEIEYWLTKHPVDRLLPVLTAGELVWDADRGDFDPDRSTAVPAALHGVFSEEPRHLDLRWARAETELDLRHSKFRDAVADLAAGMHGMSKEDLDSEDVARHRRVLRLLRGVAAFVLALLMLVAGVGVVAVQNARDAATAAQDALRAMQLAERERGTARTATAEARRQKDLAETEQQRAQRAGVEARRQQTIATAEQARAQRAAAEARRQQTIADQQQARADRASTDANQQRATALEEQRRAEGAAAEAERQRDKADEEQRRAQAAAAEAERQQARAAEEQRKAEEAAAEARRQQRIAVGRRLLADADTARDRDAHAANQLGIAAARLFPGNEAQASLVNTLTATHYAGTLTDNTGPAKLICLSDDGRAAATSTADGAILVWDLTNQDGPRRLGRITGHADSVAEIALSADGRTVAYAANKIVHLWDLTDGAATKFADITIHTGGLTALALSADGRTLLTSSWDNTTRLWDLSTRRAAHPRAQLTDRTDVVYAATFSRDGRTLVTGGNDKSVRLMDVTEPTPRLLAKLTAHSSPVDRVTLSADARTLVTSGDTTFVWDLTKPTDPARLGAVGSNRMEAAAFSADGRTLATIDSWDKVVYLWDVTGRARPREIARVTSHIGLGNPVGLSHGAHTLINRDEAGTLRLWDLSDRIRPERSAYFWPHPTHSVASAMLSADGRTVATGLGDQTVRLWDIADRTQPAQLAQLPGTSSTMDIVALSRDGTTLATASTGDDTVVVWDLSDPSHPRQFAELTSVIDGSRGWVEAVALTTDGNTLAISRDDDSLALWDLTGRTHTELAQLSDVGDVDALTFTADGTGLAADADGDVVVWDVTDRADPKQRLEVTTPNRSVDALAFSADGRILAAGEYRGPVVVWDLSDPKQPRRLAYLTDHTSPVMSVALSADGRTLATGSDDKTARLWDLTDRTHVRRLAQLNTSLQRVAAVTLSADAQTLVTASWDRSVQVWDLSNLNRLRENPVERACAITGGFDRDEWARYVGDLPYEETCP